MNLAQVGVLAVEATVMAVIILGLFRARTVLGLTPLYIVLGGFQYLEAILALKVTVVPGYSLYPASTALFPATLVSVLLIYVKEDAIEARKLVYGLVLANASVSIISLLIGWHAGMPGSVPSGMMREHFLSSAYISTVGTSLLFLDALGIILMYEVVSRFARGLFPRFAVSLLTIIAFDNAVFTMIVHGGRSDFGAVLIAGFAGKTSASLFYSCLAWAYLRFLEPQQATVGTGDVADVFHALTYRQKYEQARQRMVRDGLTGLFNRGYFDEVLPQALARAHRYGDPLSLVMVDIDHFKSINDQLSHMEGDDALRLIADTLRVHARAVDVPCRFGGDEFVVLLNRADAAAARAFADRFRTGLQDRCLTARPPFLWGRVTTTVGIATFPIDSQSGAPEELVRIADERLYIGKRAGRDRIVGPQVEAAPRAFTPGDVPTSVT